MIARAALLFLLSAAMLVAPGTIDPQRALACSVSPDFDAVRDSDAIVEGRFLSIEILGDDTDGVGVPVRLTMDVHRVFKGNVEAGTFAMEDRNSLHPSQSEYVWSGSGGSCGAFDADPTGSYAILGLSQRDDGTYSPSGPLRFFLGDGPSGTAYEEAVSRLISKLGPGGLPSNGSGSSGSGPSMSYVAAAIAGLAALGSILLVVSLKRTWA